MLKLWYTSWGQEQEFWRCFTDGHNSKIKPEVYLHEILFTGGLVSKKRAVDFYKKGISELEIGLQISCDEEGM